MKTATKFGAVGHNEVRSPLAEGGEVVVRWDDAEHEVSARVLDPRTGRETHVWYAQVPSYWVERASFDMNRYLLKAALFLLACVEVLPSEGAPLTPQHFAEARSL